MSMMLPEYKLPDIAEEKLALELEIKEFVAGRCRKTIEEINSYIASNLEPKRNGTFHPTHGVQLKINFDNNNNKPIEISHKANLFLNTTSRISGILSEENQYAPGYINNKIRKLGKHNLGYEQQKTTLQLARQKNGGIDYATYMKRLLLESGNSWNTYQWKLIIDKLFIDMH